MSIDPITGAISSAVGTVNSTVKSINGVVSGNLSAIGGGITNPELEKKLLWPIHAKGGVDKIRTKLNPMGDPKIAQKYHNALEQGRLMEKSISDAQFWLQQKKKDLMEKIQHYFHLQSVATDAQFSKKIRRFKLAADVITIIKAVNEYQQEIIGLIQAVTTNIGILQSMEANMLGTIQSNMNALANLLHEICNWGLPDLPALPNFFGDTVWRWNGFNFFPLQSFNPLNKVGFDFNFAFNQCVIHLPNLDIFRNYPSTITDGQGLVYGQPPFIPPLGGHIPTWGNLNDPNFVTFLKTTNTEIGPYYNPDTNPDVMMWGSVPNPATIISNYYMTPDVYADNIVSILEPTRDLVIQPTDSDYTTTEPSPERKANLRKALMHYVTLEEVVASNFDPILTSAWLLYVESARTGRDGRWIQNYEVAYTQYLQPSITRLQQDPVPWNNVIDGPGVTYAPQSTILGDTLKAMGEFERNSVLWKLSYIEASLLGYNRSHQWDDFSFVSYVSDFTSDDLDFRSTPLNSAVTNTMTLGADEAMFPVDCTYPASISNVLKAVIETAHDRIIKATNWRSQRPQFRYIYDQFAQAKEVDRFTQFWREFNTNLQNLLLQDPYLIQFVVSYPESLDSAIDPLGDPAIFNQLKLDAATRNRNWTPGNPLLKIPKVPILTDPAIKSPTSSANGWYPTDNPEVFDLDPVAFLNRPDIRAQNISTQMAMLRTNLSYAGLMKQQAKLKAAIQEQVENAQQLLQDFKNVGFRVEMASSEVIPVGEGALVAFDNTIFDLTGNVTSPTQFTIQTSGNYAVVGQLNWGDGLPGARSVAILNGSNAIAMTATDNSEGDMPTLFHANVFFNAGDVITVKASHNLEAGQELQPGGYLIMTKFSDEADPELPKDAQDGSTVSMKAAVNFPVMVAVKADETGRVAPVDPTKVLADANGFTIYPYPDGISMEPGVAGTDLEVATSYGDVYFVEGLNLTPGALLYIAADGTLTQDFNSLTTTVQWIICVGRAVSKDTFLYEPHLPSRTVMGF